VRNATPTILRAWLYEVDQDGTSRPIGENGPRSAKTVPEGAALRVSVEGGQDTVNARYLRIPSARGMSSEPVTVSTDLRARYWQIRNSGRTNTLRVQQYGLAAVPLHPGAAMAMSGEDVAIWIPVDPSRTGVVDWGESFRLLILAAPRPRRVPEDRGTKYISVPRRALTPHQQQAIIAYFGEHLSWPPLPAPHVRMQSEVAAIAEEKNSPSSELDMQRWARNRHDVLAGRDGLFTAANWYPRLGGPSRALSNHLPAYYRLVELGVITLPRIRQWVGTHEVEPYIRLAQQLGTGH
jgi:hypothetical protein